MWGEQRLVNKRSCCVFAYNSLSHELLFEQKECWSCGSTEVVGQSDICFCWDAGDNTSTSRLPKPVAPIRSVIQRSYLRHHTESVQLYNLATIWSKTIIFEAPAHSSLCLSLLHQREPNFPCSSIVWKGDLNHVLQVFNLSTLKKARVITTVG